MRLRSLIGFLLFPLIWNMFSCTDPEMAEDHPGDKKVSGIQVPEGFEVEMVAGPGMVKFPMFGTVDENGRLFLFESVGHVYKDLFQDAINNPQYQINMLEDIDGDGKYDKSTLFADKLSFPQGGVFYKGSLIVCSAPDLLKLTDTDGDGVADKREVLLSGWKFSVGANSFVGPFMAPDGWLYMTSAIMGFDLTTQEGEHLKGETSRIWRALPDGSRLEWISAGSMNNPVELTFTEASEPIGTETYFTDPKGGLRDAIVYWTEGGVYPKPHEKTQRDKLVRTGDLMPVVSQYSRVSPSGIGRYRSDQLGKDFKDNLFSAQFNTHRILRHKLARKGASFVTEDEPFFWSDDKDFHPTDVLEDADGSLLVVETGGWFTWGCPLSQVAKPELEGAIYRIRKKGASRVKDPYGKKIEWDIATAAKLLEDKRPFVTDKAVQFLVDNGDAAVEALLGLLKKSSSADARTKAVFALYRIGSAETLPGIQHALDDKDEQVRIAAARVAGLSRDQRMIAKLASLVQTDNAPAVRRQAATALGQIGDEKAVADLLAAAGHTEDRFVEHGIIYALIRLNRPELVEPALHNSSPQVRKAALIALDQMPGSPLKPGQLIPFLTSPEQALQHTALWISSHHPEWSKDMMAFLSERFREDSLTDNETKLLGDILAAFCGDTRLQQFMAQQMKHASASRQLFLLDAMSACSIEKVPAEWISQLASLLASPDERIAAKAVHLVRMRGLTSLKGQVTKVVDNKNNTLSLRLEALSALLNLQPALSNAHFDLLYQQLRFQKETALRMQAANVLTQSKLSESQLLQLIGFLSDDDTMLPRLLTVFKGPRSIKVGEPLIALLKKLPGLASFTEEHIRGIFEDYPAAIDPSLKELLSKLHQERAGRLQHIQELEKEIPKGNMERGRALYFSKATCFICHTIGEEGGTLGPDLTSIAQTRSAHDLLEAIVYPGVSIVREFETYRIQTKTSVYTGIIQQQGPDAIVLRTDPQGSVRIPREDIVSSEMLDVSMMPQGLDRLLSPQEMSDLMAFLIGQDQDPKKNEELLR